MSLNKEQDKLKISHFDSEGKFFKNLDIIEKFSNTPLKVVVFMYDKRYDLLSIFSEFESDIPYIKKFTLLEDLLDKTLYSCEIERDSNDNISKVYLLLYKYKKIVLLISNQRKLDWKKSLKFFNNFYPFLTRIFLRSFQILKVLKFVEEKSKLSLIAKSYVAKRYFGSERSEICYEKISYNTAFNQAMGDNLWIDSIWVGIEFNGEDLGNIRLNRKGIFSFTGISFSDFYEKFIKQVINFYLESYLSIIEDKSRSIENLEANPVKVILSDDVFIDNASFNNFIEKIKSGLKNWGYSVLSNHGIFGQMMLHDYDSGGNFDIFISSSREIYIVPQTQVTEVTFNKLLTIVLDNFEGEIENV